MLEHVPAWLGRMLGGLRAGHGRLTIADDALRSGDGYIALSSPAFADGDRLPERFTADGAGVSPPLAWSGVPAGTASLVLVVEDPDAPAPHPLVHALLWALPADATMLTEGAIRADAGDNAGPAPEGGHVGRNSYLAEGWLPPDPPTGHGTHDYVFQLFALNETPAMSATPGRSEIVAAMAGRVIAAGMLIGTYSRGVVT